MHEGKKPIQFFDHLKTLKILTLLSYIINVSLIQVKTKIIIPFFYW